MLKYENRSVGKENILNALMNAKYLEISTMNSFIWNFTVERRSCWKASKKYLSRLIMLHIIEQMNHVEPKMIQQTKQSKKNFKEL